MRSQVAADGTTRYSSLMLSSCTYTARDRITNRIRKPYGDGDGEAATQGYRDLAQLPRTITTTQRPHDRAPPSGRRPQLPRGGHPFCLPDSPDAPRARLGELCGEGR